MTTTLTERQNCLVALSFKPAVLQAYDADPKALVEDGLAVIHDEYCSCRIWGEEPQYQVAADIANGLTALLMAKQDLDWEKVLDEYDFVEYTGPTHVHYSEEDFHRMILPYALGRLNSDPVNDKSGAGGAAIGGVLEVIFSRQKQSGSAREQMKSGKACRILAEMVVAWRAKATELEVEYEQKKLMAPKTNLQLGGVQRKLGEYPMSGAEEDGESEEATQKRVEDLEREDRMRIFLD